MEIKVFGKSSKLREIPDNIIPKANDEYRQYGQFAGWILEVDKPKDQITIAVIRRYSESFPYAHEIILSFDKLMGVPLDAKGDASLIRQGKRAWERIYPNTGH